MPVIARAARIGRRRGRRAAWVVPVLLLAPALAALALVFAYPILRALVMSASTYDSFTLQFHLSGLGNYGDALRSGDAHAALLRSGLWVAGSVAGQYLAGLGVALLLNEKWPGNRLVRILVIVPWVTPGIAVGLIWRLIYHPDVGLLNDLLQRAGLPQQAWLSNPHAALWAVVVASVWYGFPFVAITLLAGLSAIPAELYEAARIDGAKRWTRFRTITLPLLRPISLVVVLLSIVWAFNTFDLIFVLTRGGPGGATETLPLLVYREAFESFQVSGAAALSVLMTAISLVVTAAYVVRLRKASSVAA
jgi:multiple sugar transport system permease protein